METEPGAFNDGSKAHGTGPYRFVEFERGDRIVFEANPAWWKGKPKWDRVTIRWITSGPARTAALLSGDVDVIADMIVVMDQDLQVTWTWNMFDWLDRTRLATGGETCVATAVGSTAGCGNVLLIDEGEANDWTHSNGLGPRDASASTTRTRSSTWKQSATALACRFGRGSSYPSIPS